jgi:hypothetical protein
MTTRLGKWRAGTSSDEQRGGAYSVIEVDF